MGLSGSVLYVCVGVVLRERNSASVGILEKLLELYALPSGTGLAARRHPNKLGNFYVCKGCGGCCL